MNDSQKLLQMRKRIFLGAYAAGIGHVASSMSLVEILFVLFEKGILKYDPGNPDWSGRDRLILSKGHGSLALYAALAEKGYFDESELYRFGTVRSRLGGEPVLQETAGIEASTGSLGHGLSIGVGMAMALKGTSSRVFVILGDGECQEGSVWEAMISASRFGLSNLTAIVDDNKIQKMGRTDAISGVTNLRERWECFGWETLEADGHDVEALQGCLCGACGKSAPTVVIAHTVKGKGIRCMENKPEWHYRMPGKKELKAVMEELDISEEELRYAKSFYKQNV